MTSVNRHYMVDKNASKYLWTSQRPPVPGKEDKIQELSGNVLKQASDFSKNDSSIFMPRRPMSEKLLRADSSKNAFSTHSGKFELKECAAPLGFEPEGSVTFDSNFQESSNSSGGGPSYLKWAESLTYLLQDIDGVKLFKEFLEQDNSSSYIDFWFACNGLKLLAVNDAKLVGSLAKSIYKKYVKGDGMKLKASIKRIIVERFKTNDISQSIFDEAQFEIEEVMRNKFYPSFLKSDLLARFIETEQHESPKQSSSSDSLERGLTGVGICRLPTLQEDEELSSDINQTVSFSSVSYLSSEDPRKSMGDLYHRNQHLSGDLHNFNPCHVSYAPVSTLDSELQSVSSEALTDDTTSYTDSSCDGREFRSRTAFWKYQRMIKRYADVNQHTGLNFPFVSRTEIVAPASNLSETSPQEFAHLLTAKLLKVKEEQDRNERASLAQSAKDLDGSCSSALYNGSIFPPKNSVKSSLSFTSMLLASSATESDQDAQSILDNHVSNIWNSSGPTPSRSPSQQRSMRGWQTQNQPSLTGGVPRELKPKEPPELPFDVVPSKSRSNQGGVFQMALAKANNCFQHLFTKDAAFRKQNTDFNVASSAQKLPPNISSQGHSAQGNSCAAGSVINPRVNLNPAVVEPIVPSGSVAMGAVSNGAQCDKQMPVVNDSTSDRVMSWIQANEKYSGCSKTRCSTDTSEKNSSQKRSSHMSSEKKSGIRHKSTKHGNCDQTPLCFSTAPSKTSDPMPVSEVKTTKPSANSLSKECKVVVPNKTKIGKPGQTVIGYYFCEESIPYRISITGDNVTLGQLKQAIGKKGNFRYFFKTVCTDFDSGVVHEEVLNDEDVLPMWDGKIVCKIEAAT